MTLWKELVAGFVEGIRPFGPAVRVMAVSAALATGVMLVGVMLLSLVAQQGEGRGVGLQWLAEGVILAGAVMLVVGCLRAWWIVIRAEWKRNASWRSGTSEKEEEQ